MLQGLEKETIQLVGDCEQMQQLRTLIDAVSVRDCTLLIQGESGTGKELVAQMIHQFSNRKQNPFIAIDCTNLGGTLLESQLFGHVKGSFTGAINDAIGFFRAAEGGVLFLDEIGELDMQVQAKLLRSIQEKAVVPVGGVKPIPVNVRILAATHRDLFQMVRTGNFREDLYYRLNVVCLEVPPLRLTRDDILPLADHFLEQLADVYQEPIRRLGPDAAAAMSVHAWPGNVRELANAIEHAYVLAKGNRITLLDLPRSVQPGAAGLQGIEGQFIPLEVAERSLISDALQASKGNQSLAAQLLQIDRRRLYRKIKRYGLGNMTRGGKNDSLSSNEPGTDRRLDIS